MAFKDSLRLEQIYFQKLKDMIKTCKAWYDGENTDKDRDILEALIQACAAILLLYRNLGEEWNELTALIQRTMHDLVDLKDKTDAYHDELNEKIDEVNNYLNSLIAALEIRVEALETDVEKLKTPIILQYFDYDEETDADGSWLKYNGVDVEYNDVVSWYSENRTIYVLYDTDIYKLISYPLLEGYEGDAFVWTNMDINNSYNKYIKSYSIYLYSDNSVEYLVDQNEFLAYGALLAPRHIDFSYFSNTGWEVSTLYGNDANRNYDLLRNVLVMPYITATKHNGSTVSSLKFVDKTNSTTSVDFRFCDLSTDFSAQNHFVTLRVSYNAQTDELTITEV